MRTVANAAAPASMPTLARQNSVARNGDQAHNILVVSADDLPGKPPVLPMGELAGSFIISPQPMPARPGTSAVGSAGGGLEAKGAPGVSNGSGAGAAAAQSQCQCRKQISGWRWRNLMPFMPVLDPAQVLVTAGDPAAKGRTVVPALEEAPPTKAADREAAPVTVLSIHHDPRRAAPAPTNETARAHRLP